ncbi:hypothetical protein UlMin_037487 [Ulmus minor]
MEYIERGDKIDENVQREIINHRYFRHPNIVKFKEPNRTNTIVMEYAYGEELFERICNAWCSSEDEQLIFGVTYCHSMFYCYPDLITPRNLSFASFSFLFLPYMSHEIHGYI